MRTLVFGLIAIVLAVAGGLVMTRLLGADTQLRDLTLAIISTIAAVVAASAPIFLTRGQSQATVVQAGLIATILHLLTILVAGGIVVFGRISQDTAFFLWLCVLYFTTLIALVAAIAKTVRQAPIAGVKA